jgi:hypothetical protein
VKRQRFHDEWDWIGASFNLEVLMAYIRDFQEGSDDIDLSQAFEIEGSTKISVTDENEEPTGELTTLDEEYVADAIDGAYCIANLAEVLEQTLKASRPEPLSSVPVIPSCVVD